MPSQHTNKITPQSHAPTHMLETDTHSAVLFYFITKWVGWCRTSEIVPRVLLFQCNYTLLVFCACVWERDLQKGEINRNNMCVCVSHTGREWAYPDLLLTEVTCASGWKGRRLGLYHLSFRPFAAVFCSKCKLNMRKFSFICERSQSCFESVQLTHGILFFSHF